MSGHIPGPYEVEDKLVYKLTERRGNRGMEKINQFSAAVYRGHDCTEDQAEATARLMAGAPELLDALTGLVRSIDDLISESYGVAGLHRNGDVAPWSELTEGGRFEEWLLALVSARAAIAKATGES